MLLALLGIVVVAIVIESVRSHAEPTMESRGEGETPAYPRAAFETQESTSEPSLSSSSSNEITIAPSAPVLPPKAGKPPMYNTESWRPIVIPIASEKGIPIEFLMKWIDVESGGQPCAVGNKFASYDNGVHPLEAGLVQLYGPDDYKLTGADPTAIRAYCKPKYLAPTGGKGADGKPLMAMAFSQECSRPLTPAEMGEAVRYSAAKVLADAQRASQILASVGSQWSHFSPDYWKFVKLQHALPGLAKAISYTKLVLGYAPKTWSEYRTTVMLDSVQEMIKEHDPLTWKYREGFANDLENADKTGSVVVAPPSVSV